MVRAVARTHARLVEPRLRVLLPALLLKQVDAAVVDALVSADTYFDEAKRQAAEVTREQFEERVAAVLSMMKDVPPSHGLLTCQTTFKVMKESATFLAGGRAAFLQVPSRCTPRPPAHRCSVPNTFPRVTALSGGRVVTPLCGRGVVRWDTLSRGAQAVVCCVSPPPPPHTHRLSGPARCDIGSPSPALCGSRSALCLLTAVVVVHPSPVPAARTPVHRNGRGDTLVPEERGPDALLPHHAVHVCNHVRHTRRRRQGSTHRSQHA